MTFKYEPQTKRERVEDLGRLAVMLDQLLDHPLFSELADEQADFESRVYNNADEALNVFEAICDVRHKISDCFSLARFGDD